MKSVFHKWAQYCEQAQMQILNKKQLIFSLNDTIYINWPLVPCMSHLEAETLESARITARNDINFLGRRSGQIPISILEMFQIYSADHI